jgi:hypothetical protein
MKKLLIKLAVAVLTFSIGATFASWRLFSHRRIEPQSPPPMMLNSKLDAQLIFITPDIRWKLPPEDIVKEMGLFYEGSGSLMILYPSGDLAVIRCDLRKDGETGQISLDGVVSFSVDKGKWWRNSNGTITTLSRFCVSPMGLDGSNDPPSERIWTIVGESTDRVADLLVSGDESVISIPADFRDIDGIKYTLRFASGCN